MLGCWVSLSCQIPKLASCHDSARASQADCFSLSATVYPQSERLLGFGLLTTHQNQRLDIDISQPSRSRLPKHPIATPPTSSRSTSDVALSASARNHKRQFWALTTPYERVLEYPSPCANASLTFDPSLSSIREQLPDKPILRQSSSSFRTRDRKIWIRRPMLSQLNFGNLTSILFR